MKIPTLVSMERTKADKAREAKAYKEMDTDVPDYPYGTSIHLTDEQINKLGITEDMDTSDGVYVCAEGIVTEDSIRKIGGKTKRSLSIQLTKMAVVVTSDEDSDAAEVLYGDKS